MQTAAKIIGNHVRLFADAATINTVLHSVSRARATNVATIVTSTAHGLFTGAIVAIAALGGSGYANATATITVVDATSFTYADTGTDEATTPDTSGTITQAGTASKTLRPGANDSNWYDVGIIGELSFDRKQTADQIFAPNPGRIELADVIETKVINGVKFQTEQLSGKLIEILMGSDKITSDTGAYTPAAKITKKAWLEVIQYDHADALVNTAYLFCYVTITGDVKFGDKHVAASWEAQKLISTFNGGTLS